MRKSLALGALMALVLTLSGCGKVAQSPVSPLISPPVVAGFDAGLGTFGWRYQKYLGTDYSSFGSLPASCPSGVFASTDHTYGDSAGSAKVLVTLGQTGDSVDTGWAYSAVTDIGLTGKVLSAWVFWDSGLNAPSGKSIAKFYVKLDTPVNSYSYASGPDTTLVLGRWVQVTWSIDSFTPDANFNNDPAVYRWAQSRVREWGIEFYGATGPFTPGVVYLDQIGY